MNARWHALLLIALAGPVHAGAGTGTEGVAVFDVAWFTLDGGGGRTAAAGFVLDGTIGQPDADPLQPSAGGPYEVTGGYWTPGAPAVVTDAVFADGFE